MRKTILLNLKFQYYIINYAMLSLAFCLLCVNCTNKTQTSKDIEDNGIREINIIDNLSDAQNVKLSTIASSIDYCALEANKKSLLPLNMLYYATNNHVVAIGDHGCYVFDRKTGDFVRQVARKGQGPGEYTEVVDRFWDAKNEQVCFWNGRNYLFYNIDGTFSHQTGRFRHHMDPFFRHEDLYVGYVSNRLANEKSRIAFYDKKGILVDSIYNYRSWERTRPGYSGVGDNWMYIFHDSLYYKDIYCDTLYQIKDFMLHPRYIFNTGGLAVPYEMQEGGQHEMSSSGMIDRYEKYINFYSIHEDNKYLYIRVKHKKKYHYIMYDKKENTQMGISVFENDLDGGLPFWPMQMISDKEMMGLCLAEALLELDRSKITDEKLINLLNNLDEDSNPLVVAIVTLK